MLADAALPETEFAQVTGIVATVGHTCDALRQDSAAPPVFLAFWDFDGTILKGDCTEGLEENGKPVYPGLLQAGIEAGFSAMYPASNGFARCWEDYKRFDQRIGHWLAYPFIVQIFRGAPERELQALAVRHFDQVLSPYYFAASVQMMRDLEKLGVEHHVISASAEIWVQGAAASIGLPVDRLHGIAVRVEAGRLTDELIYPVTCAEGKRRKLEEIIAATRAAQPGRPVYAVAAFGNSYGSDGPFLRHVARQQMPAGRPLAVMINGGIPPAGDEGLFR